jgi:hypothetical protein
MSAESEAFGFEGGDGGCHGVTISASGAGVTGKCEPTTTEHAPLVGNRHARLGNALRSVGMERKVRLRWAKSSRKSG